jgi:hypothetical protein
LAPLFFSARGISPCHTLPLADIHTYTREDMQKKKGLLSLSLSVCLYTHTHIYIYIYIPHEMKALVKQKNLLP